MKQLVALVFAWVLPAVSMAGGYNLKAENGSPARWSTATPITFNLDIGTLGLLTKEQADAMVEEAFAVWSSDNNPHTTLSFQRGPDLAEDHGNGVSSNPAWNDASPDGINPVVYDQNGLITAGVFPGAENVLIAFSEIRFTNVTPTMVDILEGRIVINGRFMDGNSKPPDVSMARMKGAVVHEIGHFLNLRNSSTNNAFNHLVDVLPIGGYTPDLTHTPTMYPFIHDDSATLAADDIAWISFLYPSALYHAETGSISGRVHSSEGVLTHSINVVARSVSDPLLAISCVSGYNVATTSPVMDAFHIPGLPIGSRWVLDIENIPTSFTGNHAVTFLVPTGTLPRAAEFINDQAFKSGSDATAVSTTFTVGATMPITGIDIHLNPVPEPLVVQPAVPPTNVFPESATVLRPEPGRRLKVEAVMDANRGGNIAFDENNPVIDWYVLEIGADLELTRVELQPPAGKWFDLDIVSYSGGDDIWSAYWAYNNTAGAPVIAMTAIDSSTFGVGSAHEGRIYIGVTPLDGANGPYSLFIDISHSDKDAVVLSSVEKTGSDTIRITGRGFKNTGGAPVISFDDPTLNVLVTNFVSSSELTATLTASNTFNSSAMVQVMNRYEGGGYGGRIAASLFFIGENALSQILSQLLGLGSEGADVNHDTAIDAGDVTTVISE